MSKGKTLILSPSLLYLDDLFAFESYLRETLSVKDEDVLITGTEKGKAITTDECHSLNELFARENLPMYLDRLTFEFKQRDDKNEIQHTIRVELDKRVSDIQLSSEDEDNVWIKEIGPKLKSFTKQRRPWYWFIGLSIPPVFNISLGLSLLMAAFIIVSKVNQAFVFPMALFLSGATFMALGVKRVVFRHARICLFQKDEDVRPNYELFVIFFHITVLVVAATGTVIMTAGKI